MKNISKSESVFRKKGFYIALYSCIGVVLLLAAVISFYGINEPNESAKAESPALLAESWPEVSETINPSTKKTIPESSYLTPNSNTAAGNEVAKNTPAANPATSTTPNKTPSATTGSSSGIAQSSNSGTTPSFAPSTTSGTTPGTIPSGTGTNPGAAASPQGVEAVRGSQSQIEENKTAPAEPKKQEDSKSTDVKNIDVTTQKVASAEFAEFTDGDSMQWPTFGEIVMDYSPEHVIYDVTLEQFRTNDNICIAAQAGAQVKASAEGVVKSVSNSRETGNTVVIDHGNGWETTYSQLQDQILVAEGDVVKTGQVIGGVGNPSNYSVLLGNHLGFKVSKLNEKIDPRTVLAD